MPANGILHVPLRLSAELREGGILRRQACERSNGVSTCVTLKCPALVDTDPLSREEEFTMPKSHNPYPLEFKHRLVEMVRAGRNPDELAEKFEPTAQSIRN
jgi:hypothetical protein